MDRTWCLNGITTSFVRVVWDGCLLDGDLGLSGWGSVSSWEMEKMAGNRLVVLLFFFFSFFFSFFFGTTILCFEVGNYFCGTMIGVRFGIGVLTLLLLRRVEITR